MMSRQPSGLTYLVHLLRNNLYQVPSLLRDKSLGVKVSPIFNGSPLRELLHNHPIFIVCAGYFVAYTTYYTYYLATWDEERIKASQPYKDSYLVYRPDDPELKYVYDRYRQRVDQPGKDFPIYQPRAAAL